MTRRFCHAGAAGRNGCGGVCCTKIENFSAAAGGTVIFRDVNIHIHCGDLTALIGPNGAGKSTLLKAILGEARHSGAISFCDADGKRAGQPRIGYVPQALNFDPAAPTSVLDLFAASLSRIPAWLHVGSGTRRRVAAKLGQVQAAHLIDRRLGALSGGELQRVLLALALAPVPDLLLLDEPVSGIDQNGLEIFYDIVSRLREENDLSIILVSHDLPLVAKHADRVILLNKTVLASGAPAEVFRSAAARRAFAPRAGLASDGGAAR